MCFGRPFAFCCSDSCGVCVLLVQSQCCTDVRYWQADIHLQRRMSAFGGKADIVLAITFGNSLWNRWGRSMLSR